MQSVQWSMIQVTYFTLNDLITKYKNEITPSKKGSEVEYRRLRMLLRKKDIMKIPLVRIISPTLASFRDRRLKDGFQTYRYDLVLIRHTWNIVRIDSRLRHNINRRFKKSD